MAPCSFQTPRTAQLRLPSSRATPRVASRQFAKARPTSAAAAARRASDAGGGDSRNTAAAASATADFAVSCPWPRPPSSYAESPSEQELPIRRRAALFVAKLMNGDTGSLPPAVARLGGAFTDGCVVADEDGSGEGPSSSCPSLSSIRSPLLRAAARFWRYQGMR